MNGGGSGIIMLAEGMTMESFLKEKRTPGANLQQMVDNYSKMYHVPSHVLTTMHKIRMNRNIVAHNLTKQPALLNYHSSTMKSYQDYYYFKKNKPQRQARYNVYFDGRGAQKVKRSTQGKSSSVQRPAVAATPNRSASQSHKPVTSSRPQSSVKPSSAPRPTLASKPAPKPIRK